MHDYTLDKIEQQNAKTVCQNALPVDGPLEGRAIIEVTIPINSGKELKLLFGRSHKVNTYQNLLRFIPLKLLLHFHILSNLTQEIPPFSNLMI
jgi:hypothetical protein